MADQSGFVVYFLSADIQELIDKGATDIKISGAMKNGKLELHAEGINTKEEDPTDNAGNSVLRSVSPLTNHIKIPCPMPCSTSQK